MTIVFKIKGQETIMFTKVITIIGSHYDYKKCNYDYRLFKKKCSKRLTKHCLPCLSILKAHPVRLFYENNIFNSYLIYICDKNITSWSYLLS